MFAVAKQKAQKWARFLTWQGRQDLNLRHPVLETGALPTELLPYVFNIVYNSLNGAICHWQMLKRRRMRTDIKHPSLNI